MIPTRRIIGVDLDVKQDLSNLFSPEILIERRPAENDETIPSSILNAIHDKPSEDQPRKHFEGVAKIPQFVVHYSPEKRS